MCRHKDGLEKNRQLPANYRFMAYRHIVFTIYGRTRKKMSRMPLPSCCINSVRSTFPDPSGKYTGFRIANFRYGTQWITGPPKFLDLLRRQDSDTTGRVWYWHQQEPNLHGWLGWSDVVHVSKINYKLTDILWTKPVKEENARRDAVTVLFGKT